MASKIKELEAELEEANARIEELEGERDGVLDALGVEVVDDVRQIMKMVCFNEASLFLPRSSKSSDAH